MVFWSFITTFIHKVKFEKFVIFVKVELKALLNQLTCNNDVNGILDAFSCKKGIKKFIKTRIPLGQVQYFKISNRAIMGISVAISEFVSEKACDEFVRSRSIFDS